MIVPSLALFGTEQWERDDHIHPGDPGSGRGHLPQSYAKFPPDAEPDADYPVRLSARYSYTELWHGNGVVGFERPNAVDAPYSSHILAVLAGVPNLGYEPAWRARGSMELPRTDVRRLA